VACKNHDNLSVGLQPYWLCLGSRNIPIAIGTGATKFDKLKWICSHRLEGLIEK